MPSYQLFEKNSIIELPNGLSFPTKARCEKKMKQLPEVFEASLKVEMQRKMIAAMRTGDPFLPYALQLLRELEQNAAVNNINDALADYNASCQLDPRAM